MIVRPGRGTVVAGLVAMLLVACASAPRHTTPRPDRAAAVVLDAGSDVVVAPATDELPSLDALAARGAAELPLMREIARSPDASAKPIELASTAADACFRALVAASAPIRAWFEDDRHASRGEVGSSAGFVPPRGPACARRGETLRLVVAAEGPDARVRAVIWQAP